MADGARIGIDIGGTFTDVVTVADGRLRVTKTPSTPDAPAEGVLQGFDVANSAAGIDPSAVTFLGHGTTVATNAVLEREWAETALVTTEGFRDALEIGRQTRPALYDLHAEKPAPVVERDRRYEVAERLDERGEVVEPLNEEAVRALAAEIGGAVESVAVCLLFAFENDRHERTVADILETELDVTVSRSSAVLPEIKEYERSLTTALNAGLRPILSDYLERLTTAFDGRSVPTELTVMHSNGGLTDPQTAAERPVGTLLSGPAAGVQGAAHVAGLAGFDDVLTMDMGGTSCDVSLVREGDPVVSTDVEVGDYPVAIPMTDVHTIGAGGGSIAWLDEGGALRVGPKSAGAQPGPVCYGRGGTKPTVTDAHVLLGRLDPERFEVDLSVDVEAVEHAIETTVADPLDRSLEAAAQGILDVANANMERALRVMSIERGHDPRDLALVAFGGAGPLHAVDLARALSIPTVVIPRVAGVLSALGLLVGDRVRDYSTTRIRPWTSVDPTALRDRIADFAETGRDEIDGPVSIEPAVDLRYRGQSFSLTVPIPETPDEEDLSRIAEGFHDRHRERYGHASPDEPLELATIRVRARGQVDPPSLEWDRRDGTDPEDRREGRTVRFDGESHETAVYSRKQLSVGTEINGPALIEGSDATTVLPPGTGASIDHVGNLVVAVDP
jgi:N-methylhydantoinase A